MAKFDERLAKTTSLQGAAPHLLCGWSLGGLIALEMARLLHNAGHETAVFAECLDRYLPNETLGQTVQTS
jgi:thioesterase domain-containing protein